MKRSRDAADGGGAAAASSAAASSGGSVDPTRVRSLNKVPLSGSRKAARGDGASAATSSSSSGPVLYWMSRDQRIDDNWALLYALEIAAARGAPLVIAFNLVPSFLGATLRQYGFMLRGLREVEQRALSLGMHFIVMEGDPALCIPAWARAHAASCVVCDMSPLGVERRWREAVASACGDVGIPVHEVDAHNVVPVWVASSKLEYAARTIRGKITPKLELYLKEYPPLARLEVGGGWAPAVVALPEGCRVHVSLAHAVAAPSSGASASGAAASGSIPWDALLEALPLDRTVAEVSWATPGFTAGMAALDAFLTTPSRLKAYAEQRNDPTVPTAQSNLSPWLHFGQIAPARAALAAMRLRRSAPAAVDAFIEELIVRRELTDNYCWYNPRYDELDGLYPNFGNDSWAQKTLRDHAGDAREHVYTLEQFEKGETHEALWNACQLEMVHRGKMHGFCRMYWAKKILEWSSSPAEALRIAIALNDKYELDGRDPNGYVGCAWAIAGLHDQGWAERPVFGKIRYMNLAGCKSKFNVAKYIASVAAYVPKAAARGLRL